MKPDRVPGHLFKNPIDFSFWHPKIELRSELGIAVFRVTDRHTHKGIVCVRWVNINRVCPMVELVDHSPVKHWQIHFLAASQLISAHRVKPVIPELLVSTKHVRIVSHVKHGPVIDWPRAFFFFLGFVDENRVPLVQTASNFCILSI